MNRDSVDWRGYMPAITTPFDEHGELDLGALRSLLEWLAGEGMHGLVVAGTTGEWFSMTADEKATLFGAVGEVLRGDLPLIAGCNAFTAQEVVRNAMTAERSGFDGILVTPPPYVRPCEREVIAFYEDVDRETPLPICIYNWPPGTNIDLSRETLEHLSDLEHVVAIKNSTGSPAHFIDVMRALRDKVRIFGIPMTEEGMQLVLQDAADGTMGAGAVLGRTQPEFYNALWAGDTERGLAAARQDTRIMREWFRPDYTARYGSAQAIFKTALNLQGLPGGYPRRPILPLQESEVAMVRTTLEELGRL
ncbi:dihydrodipicolinate synthase family protein [Elongatibacter sediminis]|uniref:Dihydrodipicolinate synthase family protein n=1 Tax=Elongatibacter sediminis TaxID=3119006 RepID=A0AAW9RBF5_9GAMM